MDLKMNTEETTSAGEVSWDCEVSDGIVPIIMDDEEDLQCATIAGFLVTGTIPQLPDVGVPWTDFLTGSINFGTLDYYVRDSLRNVGMDTFQPEYSIEDNELNMSIGKVTQEDAE